MSRIFRNLHSPIIYVCILALIIRLLGIWLFEDIPRGDTGWYHQTAEIFAETGQYLIPDSYSKPTAFKAPGYTIFLGSVYYVFGSSHVVGAVFSAIIGVICTYLIYFLARYFVSDRIALFCALAYSLWPSLLIVYVPKLHVETAYGLFILLVLIRTVILFRDPKFFNLFVLSIVLGLSLYFRPNLILFPAVIFVVCLMGRLSVYKALMYTGFLILIIFAILSPWIIRNYFVFGEIIILGTYGGYNFAVQVLEQTGYASGTGHYPPGVPQNITYEHYQLYWHEHGMGMWLNYLSANFVEWLQLRWKVIYFLWSWDTPHHLSTLRYSWDAIYPVFMATQVHYFTFLFFAGIGAVVSTWITVIDWLRNKSFSLVAVLLLTMVYWNSFYLLLYGHPRHHIVMLPVVIILAAIGGKWVIDKLIDMKNTQSSKCGKSID